MDRITPWAADEDELKRIHDTVLGSAIRRVRYVLAATGDVAEIDIFSDLEIEDVHEVDSVVLDLESNIAVEVLWAMSGYIEGLALTASDVSDPHDRIRSTDSVVSLDVSESRRWRRLLGQKVTDLRVARHVSHEESPETLWSLSLGMSGQSVTIALGEVRDSRIVYLPDSLVVVFSEATAKSYRPVPTTSSAWGEPFEL